MQWWGKSEVRDFVLKVGVLWIMEGTMFNVFISFKVFMNQESPSKKCFQLFIENTSKRFLEKVNFSATLPKIYFYNNSPHSFFEMSPQQYFQSSHFFGPAVTWYMFYEKHFDNLFESFNGNHYGVAWN